MKERESRGGSVVAIMSLAKPPLPPTAPYMVYCHLKRDNT